MKKALALVLTLSLCMGLFCLPLAGVSAADDTAAVAITDAQPYFFTDTNTPLSLEDVSVAFGETVLAGTEVTWQAADAAVTVAADSLTVTTKGLYELTASNGTDTMTVYAVAKDAADTEYVLLEEDFSDVAEGELPDGWTLAAGTADTCYVDADGKLVLDSMNLGNAKGNRVLLPANLAVFGDYQIEADMQFAQYKNATRWSAVMYRVDMESATKTPYYLMTFRVTTTVNNGVEFGYRNAANNGWTTPMTAPYTADMANQEVRRISVRAEGNRVIESIDGTAVIDTEMASQYQTGGIGFQADQNKTVVDNVRVTVQAEKLKARPGFAEIYQPETTLTAAPTVIAPVATAAELAEFTVDGARPSHALVSVTGGDALTAGTDMTVPQVLEAAAGKIVPVFRVEDEATADALAQYLLENEYVDVLVLSSKPELVGRVREACPLLFGAVDYTAAGALTNEMLGDMVSTANTNCAKYILLSAEQATAEAVRFLQARYMTVWVMGEDNLTAEDVVGLLNISANGVVTPDFETCFDVYSKFTTGSYWSQNVFIVAHRGASKLAPENTLEACIEAYNIGADGMEYDIYLSADGELVLMHDTTVDRTTNGTGNVESYTVAQLKELTVDCGPNYPDAKVPTLREVFEEFKDKDILHVIELKSSNVDLVPALAELIEEYDMYDKCVAITFDQNQLEKMREYLPEISTAYLVGSGPQSSVAVVNSLKSTSSTLQPLNAVLAPSASGLSKDYRKVAAQRGMPLSTWTVDDSVTMMSLIDTGVTHITTNVPQTFEIFPEDADAIESELTLATNASVELTANMTTRDGEVNETAAVPIILSGEDCVEVNGSTLTAKKPGTVTLVLGTQFRTLKRYVFTDIVTLTITDAVVGDGDVNGDGVVDSKDARLVLQYAVEAVDLTEEQQVAANVNGDTVIDSKDAREILKRAVS